VADFQRFARKSGVIFLKSILGAEPIQLLILLYFPSFNAKLHHFGAYSNNHSKSLA